MHVMTVRVILMADRYGEIYCWIEKEGRKTCKNQGNPFLLEILSKILNAIFLFYIFYYSNLYPIYSI